MDRIVYDPLRNEPRVNTTEMRPNYREITGNTYNNLRDCWSVIEQICRHLEGDFDTPDDEPNVTCFREALMANREMTEKILTKLNQIAEVIGV